MASKKTTTRSRSKSTHQRDTTLSQSAPALPATQTEEASHRSRAKNYSKEECEILVHLCSKAHTIIDKNSNSEADRKLKDDTWIRIKAEFDTQCRVDGVYVSIYHSVLYAFVAI